MYDFGYLLILLAAILYLTERLQKFVRGSLEGIVSRHFKRVEKLHDHSGDQIEASFELWWEGGPKESAQKTLVKKLAEANDLEVPADLLDNELIPYTLPILRDLEARTRHLALHAHMGNEDEVLLRRLPSFGGIRQQMTEAHVKHQEWLDTEKDFVQEHGVDPHLIEEHFSPSGKK